MNESLLPLILQLSACGPSLEETKAEMELALASTEINNAVVTVEASTNSVNVEVPPFEEPFEVKKRENMLELSSASDSTTWKTTGDSKVVAKELNDMQAWVLDTCKKNDHPDRFGLSTPGTCTAKLTTSYPWPEVAMLSYPTANVRVEFSHFLRKNPLSDSPQMKLCSVTLVTEGTTENKTENLESCTDALDRLLEKNAAED